MEAEHGGEGAKGLFASAQHVGGGVSNDGGLKELATDFVATHHDFAAFGNGVLHMALDFLHGSVFNQRALHHAVVKAVAYLQGFDLGCELLHEFVVHRVLHINAVGAHAGLAGVAVFAGHRAFHGAVDVGIVKHDERGVATQLQSQLFDAGRRLRHQDAAHFGRAGEADVAHDVAAAKHFADGNAVVAVRAEDVQHARRNARTNGQLGSRQGGEGGELGGFDHHRAASGQSRCHFAGDHGERKIPRRDGRAHADGLLEHHQAAVVVELGQGFAIHALGFFGIPLHKTRAISHLAFGFGKRLALLGGHEASQVFLVGHQQVKPLAQDAASLFARLIAPSRPSGVGRVNGSFSIFGAKVSHIDQLLAGGRVMHIKAAATFDPLAVDQGIGLEQGGVVEQRKGRCLHVHEGLLISID